METYKIIRHFFKGDNEVISTGLTLEEAQEHCNDPETSSRSCSDGGEGMEVFRTRGPFFDGYTEE